MPRSNEVVRQWEILRTLATSRLGAAVPDLAAEHGVTTRTIRRDLSALGRAGFPLYQEQGPDRLLWKLHACALKGLDTGHSLMEICALYFSRATLECLSWSPFHEELSRAFERLERTLTPSMRAFLDRIPGVVGAKPAPGGKRVPPEHRERVAQLLQATFERRMVRVRYYSHSSGRVRDYDLAPQRVVSADGGLYLRAYVPEYGELRTFAVERIQQPAGAPHAGRRRDRGPACVRGHGSPPLDPEPRRAGARAGAGQACRGDSRGAARRPTVAGAQPTRRALP